MMSPWGRSPQPAGVFRGGINYEYLWPTDEASTDRVSSAECRR